MEEEEGCSTITPGVVREEIKQYAEQQELTGKPRFILIEYPGKVKNVDKAMKTLGGRHLVSETIKERGKHMELRFRDQPTARPIFGDCTLFSGLVLKVRRRKKQSKRPRMEENRSIIATVTGIVETAYRFVGMADFQVVTPEAARVLPKPTLGWMKTYDAFAFEDDPVNLPPPIFSKIDMPLIYKFKPSPHLPKHGLKDLENISTRRVFHVQVIGFEEATPMVVEPDAMDERILIDTSVLKEVEYAFEERPIWSESALRHRLSPISTKILNKALLLVSYRFRNGPWRQIYTRLGYDPRAHLSSKKYQIIDYRCTLEQTHPTLGYSGMRWKNADQTPRRKRPAYQNVQKLVESSKNKNDITSIDQVRPLVDHTFSTPPQLRQTIYQLCDINDDKIQDVLSRASTLTTPKRGTGWYSKQTMNTIRVLMDQKLETMLLETNNNKNNTEPTDI